ncbi:MAG: hypothetical protein ACXW29_05825 [Thermoanaerobaculia bacterium]
MFRAQVLLCLATAAALAMNAGAATSPGVAVIRFPAGIMQPVGGPAESDSFVIANAGPGDASLTLVPSGTFFGLSASSFTLAAGASATVTIRPVTQQGGFRQGSISVFVSGIKNPLVVPVRLFVGQQPQGTVTPTASTNLLIPSGFAGDLHRSFVTITNRGNVTMQGMLIPSASWIVPQNDVVGIAPNTSMQMAFAVDPSQRPDAIAPLGAFEASVSMIYLKGISPSVSQTGTVNVSVFDITKVSVVPQEPSAPVAGETISFLPGVTDTFGFFTDVFLSNRTLEALSSDLRMFYTALGAPPATSLLANVGRLSAGVAAWFPFAPSSIFNVGNQTGTVQIRSIEPNRVAIAAIRGIVPDGLNRYLTSMPVLRSDRGIPAGERLVFAGVEKSTTAHTDLFVQEAAGSGGSYTIDFFDSAGAPIAPNRTGSLLPFGSVTLGNSVPAGARSARISNTSNGAARMTGFATVVDDSTFDSWTVIDSSRGPGPTSDLVLPVPALAGAPSSTFDAWITNGSPSSVSVTIGTTATPVRRRAVKRSSSIGSDASQPPITLSAGETRRIPITNTPSGYIRIGGPAGALSATGRLTSSVPGRSGTFGTGVPAIPAARAMAVGNGKRFARAGDNPFISPATLLLLEVANRPVTVRVTIAFYFSAGSTVSGQFGASRDYEVSGGQLLTIPELVRSILGSQQRDALGPLSNLVIDVDVIAGEGRVLSYLQTIDRSGDLTFSVD